MFNRFFRKTGKFALKLAGSCFRIKNCLKIKNILYSLYRIKFPIFFSIFTHKTITNNCLHAAMLKTYQFGMGVSVTVLKQGVAEL